MEDKIVNKVLEAYKKRSNVGIEKYGTTLERDDLNVLDWLQHLQEELMDATLYIEALKNKETKGKRCAITGVELTEEDTYSQKTCSYANFVERFRSKHNIPAKDLRLFVNELKSKL